MANFFCKRTEGSGNALATSNWTCVSSANVPVGNTQELISLSPDIVAGETVKYAVYQGGVDSSDPGGATLIAATGDLTGVGTYTFPSGNTVAASSLIWIVVQASGNSAHRFRLGVQPGDTACANIFNATTPLRSWLVTADPKNDAFETTMPTGKSWSTWTGDSTIGCVLTTADEAASGPVFVDPTNEADVMNKVGDTLSGVSASNWFTGATGTVTYGEETLPSGLSLNSTTGAITGTLSQAAGDFSATVEAYDDNATAPNGTVGNFTWSITNYELVFSGTTKLLNTSNSPYNPATTVNFSAVKGTIDTALTGTVYNWAAHTVTDGVPTPALTDAGLTSGTWTVFAQDVSDPTITGVYEIVAE